MLQLAAAALPVHSTSRLYTIMTSNQEFLNVGRRIGFLYFVQLYSHALSRKRMWDKNGEVLYTANAFTIGSKRMDD